jgi:hypothetical protein
MSYYAALVAAWATLPSGDTTAQKLAAMNAMTVAGPNVDVTPSQAVGALLLSGAYPALAAFAQTSAPSGNATYAAALASAKTLIAWLTVPNAPNIGMSAPAIFAAVQGMGNAIVAQETAAPGSTGFTSVVLAGLMALAETTVPWWQANGYSSPFTASDLVAAGGLS